MESLKHQIAISDDLPLLKPSRALAVVLQWTRAHVAELASAALLSIMCLQMLSVIERKSVTVDELVLIPAGYYHLVSDDVALVREHPPLCKLLAGLPVLFIQPNELAPTEADRSMNKIDLDWKYEMGFWHDNLARADKISYWARVPMIALTIALGLLLFVFTRDLFGPWAALLAVALFSLEPTVLAHGRVVQTDIPATFGFLLTAFALHRYLRARTWKLAVALGAAVGVAMLAKFSMIVLPPILLIIVLVLLWREPQRRTALAAHALLTTLVLLVIVNAGYFFYGSPLTNGDVQWVVNSFPSWNGGVLNTIRALKFLLPTDFLMGVYWQLHHTNEGHPASLLGMYGRMGWWYYYPVAFALKTTIPFLFLALSSLAWALYRLIAKREWRLLIVLVPFVLYTGFMLMSPIDIGVRYYLPAYPFLFMLSGGMLYAFLRKPLKNRFALASALIVVIAFGWMCVEAVRAYPNHIPYMNQLASAKPRWWYLSDSNVEWGDDLKQLAAYLRSRGETRVRAMALGDFITLSFYGVESVGVLGPPEESAPRYTAIGASFLNGSTFPGLFLGDSHSDETKINTFDSFRHRTPEAVIGDSIFVFRTND